ncbi:Zinc finger protein klf1 [Tolypocladium capitatum]|uniref:Zinc finger protein klf1 n=1 Tax=Tolypocladium capitatum TaxID=45235 RepID=A0A2K3Q3J5_9HYPO|nr:Zinc finger protein klf1 [Tolypocladium capitatum]
MDGSHYPSNGVNTTSAPQTYPSPTAISPNQLQTGSPLPQTLPPLQPPTSVMQPLYGSHPHTPRTPGTPNTPNSGNNLPSYQNTSQPASRPGVYSMAQNPYPPHPGYGTSGAMMPQTTTAASHPQPIAPAPAGGRGPPVLRPMPPGGIMPQPGVSSPYGPGSLMQPNPVLQDPEQPTHVVGSQGRRGILPSAPGRPAAPAAGTGAAKSTVIPVKDADGKFPCPHCTKTYLHAKHLKRHLLRHTGDRPYMCVLCRDTFSRSDILKRHFQKCSIRRGNPTGASHLSHPQAHVKKNAQAQKAAGLGNDGEMNHLNGLNNMPGDGMVHPFGMVAVSDGMNSMGGDQNQLSRSSSMNRLENGGNQDRRSMPGMGNPQPYGSEVQNSMNQQPMPNYSMPPGQNGMPMYGGSNANQQSGLDWSQMFQAGAHQTLSNHPFHPPNRGQTQIGTKTGPNTATRTTDCSSSDAVVYSKWGILSNTENPYCQLSSQILNFFYPPNEAIDPHLTGMNLHFSPDNIQDFIGRYDKFHDHAPLLHAPSFRIMEAHTSLATSMCCIGACYSDRVEPSIVREMMDALWVAMERDCYVMSSSSLEDAGSRHPTKADTEELQAVLLTSILHVWNGTPEQRHRARKVFPRVASEARRLHLLHVPGSSLHSQYSQGSHGPGNRKPHGDDWMAWCEEEQRIRLMHGIFMCDTMWAVCCNVPPQFNPFEIGLPLPCDDAAWSAEKLEDWASALGIHGGANATNVNQHGMPFRHQQPELDLALKVLLHPSCRIGKRRTDARGKWVLLYAVMSLIWRAQRDGRTVHVIGDSLPSRDWIIPYDGAEQRDVPVDGFPDCMDPQSATALSDALGKIKSNWDEDSVEDPLRSASGRIPGDGACRDAILSYWMAKHLLSCSQPADRGLALEASFMRVLRLANAIKSWAINGGEWKGVKLETVGDDGEQHDIGDSTLNMADFFDKAP